MYTLIGAALFFFKYRFNIFLYDLIESVFQCLFFSKICKKKKKMSDDLICKCVTSNPLASGSSPAKVLSYLDLTYNCTLCIILKLLKRAIKTLNCKEKKKKKNFLALKVRLLQSSKTIKLWEIKIEIRIFFTMDAKESMA